MSGSLILCLIDPVIQIYSPIYNSAVETNLQNDYHSNKKDF